MKNPTMWCARSPKGKLVTPTLSHARDNAWWALFDEMPQSFQTKYWKKNTESMKEYKRRGYTVVKVTIFPTAELAELLEALAAQSWKNG